MSLANIGSRPIRQAVAISFDDANYFATELLHTTASDTNARAVGIHAVSYIRLWLISAVNSLTVSSCAVKSERLCYLHLP